MVVIAIDRVAGFAAEGKGKPNGALQEIAIRKMGQNERARAEIRHISEKLRINKHFVAKVYFRVLAEHEGARIKEFVPLLAAKQAENELIEEIASNKVFLHNWLPEVKQMGGIEKSERIGRIKKLKLVKIFLNSLMI